MRAYYAHCLALYDTHQEARDLETIKALGWEVINPNAPGVNEQVVALKQAQADYMLLFRDMLAPCDVLVFRSLPDGRIPSGVFCEIGYAKEMGKPVLELPSQMHARGITKEQTREYLLEVGYR